MLAIYISLQAKNVESDKLNQKNCTVTAKQQTLQKSALGSSSSVLNMKQPKEQILKLKSTIETKQVQEAPYQSYYSPADDGTEDSCIRTAKHFLSTADYYTSEFKGWIAENH